MLSWNCLFRLGPNAFARLMFCLSVSAILYAAPSAFAEGPVPIEAEIFEDAPAGTALEIVKGEYPSGSGWFAFEPGHETEVFTVNPSTGAMTLKQPEKFKEGGRSPALFSIEHGRSDETQAQSSKRKFLRAAGLSDREISRRLGLVTRYEITVRIKPRHHAPQFPPRPLHFFWPAEGTIISGVAARDVDAGDEIQYRLIDQEPENWIEIDPRTGELRLMRDAEAGRSAGSMWRGVVEASDQFGLKATTTVWITEPLALPSFSISSLTSLWPRESASFARDVFAQGLDSVASLKDSLRMDAAKIADPPPVVTPPSENSAEPETASEDIATEELPAGSEQTSTPIVSFTTWVLGVLAMALASVLYLVYRKKSDAETPAEEPTSSARSAKLNTNSKPASPRIAQEKPPADSDDEFEWDSVLGSPEAASSSGGGNAGSARSADSSGLFVTDGPEETEAPLVRMPKPHGDLPVAAELQDVSPAAVLEEEIEGAPSEEELKTLLSLSASRTETDEPAPETNRGELSVSEYMSNLLSKYSKAAPKSADQDPDAVSESGEPAEAENATRRGEVPQPVYNYDRETTRSQLEQLRATSNRTAANAIRKAASRRLRKNVIRWALLVLVVAGICALRVFILNQQQ